MPAIPVPYAESWDDYFGSQKAPSGQEPAIPDIVVVAAPNIAATMNVTINDTHASPMQVDWGDGTVEAHPSGAQAHQYTREGAYRVRVWLTAYPDVYVDHPIRVVDARPKNFTITRVDADSVKVGTLIGIVYPYTIDWGDGDTRYINGPGEDPQHTYVVVPTHLSVYDSEGSRITKVIPAATSEPPVPHWDPPYPWADFAIHQAINDWVEENDLVVPPSWFQGTLADKKAYLAATFGNG